MLFFSAILFPSPEKAAYVSLFHFFNVPNLTNLSLFLPLPSQGNWCSPRLASLRLLYTGEAWTCVKFPNGTLYFAEIKFEWEKTGESQTVWTWRPLSSDADAKEGGLPLSGSRGGILGAFLLMKTQEFRKPAGSREGVLGKTRLRMKGYATRAMRLNIIRQSCSLDTARHPWRFVSPTTRVFPQNLPKFHRDSKLIIYVSFMIPVYLRVKK